MAATAIVNLISTGPAGLGISEASSVTGPLLLQLCPSGRVCVASLEQRPGASSAAASCKAPGGFGTIRSLPRGVWGGAEQCRPGSGGAQEALGAEALWFALQERLSQPRRK